MKFSALQIATLVGGKVDGNEQTLVHAIAKIEDGKEGDLCFLANPKYEDYIYTTAASVILVNTDLELQRPIAATLIRVPDAYASFAFILKTYQEITAFKPNWEIESPSFIHSEAQVHAEAYVGAFTYIGKKSLIGRGAKIFPGCYLGQNVSLGENVTLYAGVKIYDGCTIGNNVIVHSGTVIGSDGFGFAPQNGKFVKIPQIGNVVIEDDVEIGANCTIDRATMGSTLIRTGAKLDNLIQVAHNVEIGSHTVIAAQAGISGSTKIGAYCMVGGQAGIVGHIKIADQTKINAQSGVSKEIQEPGKALTGSPAFEYRKALRSQAVYKNLPELAQQIQELQKQLEELKNK